MQNKNLLGKASPKIGKKGQGTIFILVAVAIVIAIVLVIVFTQTDVQVGRKITTSQVEPIREYVEGCVEERLRIEIEARKKYGGYGFLRGPGLIGNKFDEFNVLLRPGDEGNDYIYLEPTISNEISSDIENFLKNGACPLLEFRSNFEITEHRNDIDVVTNIGENSVDLTINFLIEVKKDEFESEIKTLGVSLEDNFGLLQEYGRLIVNDISLKMENGESDFTEVTDICYDRAELKCEEEPFNNEESLFFLGKVEDFGEPGEDLTEKDNLFAFVVLK